MKFEAEGREFAKKNLTVGQNSFGNKIPFCPIWKIIVCNAKPFGSLNMYLNILKTDFQVFFSKHYFFFFQQKWLMNLLQHAADHRRWKTAALKKLALGKTKL